MNMLGMVNLSAIGISPDNPASHAQTAPRTYSWRIRLAWPRAPLWAAEHAWRPGRSGGRLLFCSADDKEEDFDPAVLNDVAGWLRTLRQRKYTPNFEGMTWKEMVVMEEQAPEAQGVAALGASGNMLKTFEVVRRKMGIYDLTAATPPPGPPPSSGGLVLASASTVGSSTSAGGGLPSA
ncbi:hypothetical protein EI94DRAFT_1142116 [Lactarius quietus]|nr:hypothetical protein EI94DRAFT_1142116 [Lactarius quietus]